jgi:hypothetical protein
MPRITLPAGVTDEDFVLGLLRATGILCVYGSGFGMPPDQGFLRIVYLAPLDELGRIYDDFGAFTNTFLAQAAGPTRQASARLDIWRLRRESPAVPAGRSSDHRLIVHAVASLLVGVVALWTLYNIRGALLPHLRQRAVSRLASQSERAVARASAVHRQNQAATVGGDPGLVTSAFWPG